MLLYELLGGAPPFGRDDLRALGLPDFLRTIREEFPPAPSTRALSGAGSDQHARRRGLTRGGLAQRLRGELDWIVMRAIEKERDRRYDSVADLVEDLARYRRGEAVIAGPPSAWYRVSKAIQRHRGRVAAATAIVVTLVAATVVSSVLAVAENRQRRTAVERGEQLVVARDRLARIADFQANMLARVDAYDVGREMRDRVRDAVAGIDDGVDRPDDPRFDRIVAPDVAADVIIAQIVEPALAAIEKDFKDDPLAAGVLLRSVGQIEARLGRADRAMTRFQRAIALLSGPDRGAERARALIALGGAQLEAGDPAAAEASARDAAALTASRSSLSRERARADQVLVLALGGQARYEEAERLARDNLEAIIGLDGRGSREHVAAMLRLVSLLVDSGGRLEEAAALADEALAAARALAPRDPSLLDALGYRAWLYELLGKEPLAALPLRREAFELARELHGVEHPSTLRVAYLLAWSLRKAEHFDEAERVTRETIATCRRVLGAEHPSTLQVLENLASLLMATGRANDAADILRAVIPVHARDRGPEHPRTLGARNDLAVSLWWLARYQEAADEWEALLPVRRRVSGANHPETIRLMRNLAQTWTRLGELDRASAMLEEVTDLCVRQHGADSAVTAASQVTLASCYDQLGRHEQAIETAQAALHTMRAIFGPDDPAIIEASHQLGRSLRLAGRLREAETVYRQAASIIAEQPMQPPWVVIRGRSRLNIGLTLTALGRFGDAEIDLLAAYAIYEPLDVEYDALAECEDALIALYDAWHNSAPADGHDASATDWRRRAEDRRSRPASE